MPWVIVHKSYGKDKRYEAIYHIRYESTVLTFDVVCKHVYDSYKWLLFCSCPHIENVLLGTPDKMKDIQACQKAVVVIKATLADINQAIEFAEQTVSPHLTRLKENR